MKRRILSLVMALFMILSTIPSMSVMVSAETEGYYTYTVSGGGATITGFDKSVSGDIKIPNTIGGYPVIAVGDSAFSNCSRLTSIEIPDSVTSIGGYAFSYCSALTSIEIPDSVISIGEDAFYKCSALTSIEIPDSVTTIGSYMFYRCSNLTSIEIPDSVTSIGYSAFYGCSALTSIEIPDSVTSIGAYAFYHCSALTSIEIPDSVTSIGDYAFYGCSALTSIEIPDSVTSIGYSAFYGCSALTSIEIPDSVTLITSNAFAWCSALTSIIIPASVISIESYAFYQCSKLTDVYYTGSEADWKNININSYCNSYLTGATIHYNYVPETSGSGNINYNNRESETDKINITIMKNNKDMTDSADGYVELLTAGFPKKSKAYYELTGYYKEEINTSNLSDGDKVYLEKSGMNVPVLRGVYLGGKDVRRDKLTIKSDFTGELSAEIDWNGQKEKLAYIDNGITQIKLTDGKTASNVNWGNFVYNARNIFIVLKTVNGYTVKKKLNISVSVNNKTPEEIELNIFDKITGVGSNVIPYLDELELSFDIPNFKLDFSVDPSDNSLKGVFGVDVAEWAYENDLRDDKKGKWEDRDKQNAYKTISKLMKDTFKEMQKNKKNQKTLSQEYKKLARQLGKAKKKTTAKFGFDAGIEVMGYVEGKVDHNGFYLSDGGIIIKANVAGSVSGEGIIWVIPYNWEVGGSAEANLNLQLAQREIREQKLTPQGSIAVTIGVHGEGGPGLKKVHLNLGVNGSLMPAWQFAPDSVFTLDGSFGIYIDATAWAWSFKKDLLEKNYRLYPKAESASLMSMSEVYGYDSYSLRERKFSDIPSEFIANKIDMFSYEAQKNETDIIKTNSYDISTPQYVKLSDGRALLVWLDDDINRAVINGTSLMYSVYDGESWTDCRYIENDGSGDYSPELKRVGDEVYLVWEDIDVQKDDETMENSLSDMDIKCARFDLASDKFTDIIQITNDAVIDSTPVIGVSDGDLVVSWIKNTSSDMFGTENTYSVEYAIIKDGAVKELKTAISGVSSIDSHIAELKNGVVNVYYIYDTDGDLSNVSDNILKTTGNTLTVTGNVSGLRNFENVIYYYSSGNIATSGNDTGVDVQNNNYFITNSGKTVLYTVQGDSMTSDIYARFYDDKQRLWGEAVRLTNLGCKITDINGYSDENGEIHLAFNKKNLSEDGTDAFYSTSDLAVLNIAPSYNVTLKDAYTENSNLIPGAEATIHIEVYNAGEKTVDTLETIVYDNEKNILSESEIDANLLSGATGEYDITYTLPDDFSPSEITVEVNPKGKEDYSTSDNSMALMLDFNNLAITGINSVPTENGYSINAIVTNTGFSKENDIEVSLMKENAVVKTTVISSLDSLASENIVFNEVIAGSEYTVIITEKDNEDILVDNEEKITVSEKTVNYDTDGYIRALDYNNGKLTANISMFSSYNASMAYLAVFDSHNMLTAMALRPVSQGEKSFDMEILKELSATENYTVKLMLWNENSKPFIKSPEYEFITQKTIVVDTVLESAHNYANNANETYTYTYEGSCESIDVKFTSDTVTENNYDYIYIYDANDNQIGKYCGTSLAGVTINVPGNTVKIKLTSDGSVNRYGFKTESITVNR